MSTILNRLSEVRNRLRLRIFIRGLTLLLLGSIIAASLFMFADHRIQSDHPMWTWGLTFCFISVLLVTAFFAMIAPLWRRLSLLDLALDIESHEHDWQHELSASVSFLTGPVFAKGTATSPTKHAPLAQEIISRTQTRLEERPPESFLSQRQTWGWTTALILSGISIIGFVLCCPVEAQFISQRLLRPGTASWPVASRLVLLTERFEIEPGPSLLIPVSIGKTYYVEDRVDSPPASLIFQTESRTGIRRALRSYPRNITDHNGNTRTLFKIHVPPDLEDGAQFRLWDDTNHSSDWYQIIRDTPIAIRHLEVTITPPDYLNQVSESFGNPSRTMECPVGSLVTIRGTTTREFANIWQQRNRKTIPVTPLGESEFEFNITATSARTTTTLFATAPQLPQDQRRPHHHFLSRFRLRGRPDADPNVELAVPLATRKITPIGTLRAQLSARDDHGLADVRLLISTNEQELATLPIKEGTVPEIEVQQNINIHLPDILADQEPSSALKPGDELTLTLQAHDQRIPEQWVFSEPITLTLISPKELLQDHASQLTSLMETIRQLATRLQTIHQHTEELATQYNASGHLLPDDRLLLQSVVDSQRQLLARINDDTGVISQLQNMSMTLRDNGAIDSPIGRHITTTQIALTTMSNTHFIPATEQLRQLTRPGNTLFDPQANGTTETATTFHQTLEHQQQALALFAELLKRGRHHSTQQQLQQNWLEANAALTQLQQSTINLGRETIGRDRNNLSDPQQASLDRLTTKYRQLSVSLNSLEEESLRAPSIHPDIKRLIQATRFSSTIASTASHIELNQMAMAIESNQTTLAQLEQLLFDIAPAQHTNSQQELFTIAATASRLADQQEHITSQTQQFYDNIKFGALSKRSRKRTRLDLIEQEHNMSTIVKTELVLPVDANQPAIQTQIEWIQKELLQSIQTLDHDDDSHLTEAILIQNRIVQRLRDLAQVAQKTPLTNTNNNQSEAPTHQQINHTYLNWQLLLLMQKRLIEREEKLLSLPNIPDHVFQQLAEEQEDIAQLLNNLADE